MTTDVTAISADDFLRPQDTELFAADINERIEEYEQAIREDQQGGREVDPDTAAAYDQLVEFRDTVQRVTGNHFDSAAIVPVDLFVDYTRDWAEEAYSLPPEISAHVNWEKFADEYRGNFTELDFGDDAVWVKG